MSAKHNLELEDKYAKKAVSFKQEAATYDAPNNPELQLEQLQKMEGLDSELKKKIALEQAVHKPGIFERKMKRIFGAVGDVNRLFLQGFKMGFVVGGIFGGLTGCYYAFQYRAFYYIPIAAITSGGSFGFFMGVGMVMRNEMEGRQP